MIDTELSNQKRATKTPNKQTNQEKKQQQKNKKTKKKPKIEFIIIIMKAAYCKSNA